MLAARNAPGWETARQAAALVDREDVDYLVVAARGTSDNAARYAQYVLGSRPRLLVALAAPWLYESASPPRLGRGAVLAISQSGRSPDIAAVLSAARSQRRPAIAMTNDPASPLAEMADLVVPLLAGEERSVAATKTYTNSLGAVALLFAETSNDAAAREELARMPDALRAQIDLSFDDPASLEEYRDAVGMTVVARGVNYCTAFEIALKIRELSGLMTEAYSPADLMHGPIAAIQPGWPVIVVAPNGPARPPVEEVLPPLRARHVRLIAVSDVRALLRRAQTRLPLVPGVPEWLSPLTAVVPGQAMALRLTLLRELDLDKPRGLRKITLTT